MHQAILLGPFIFYYTEQNKLTLEKETIDFTYSNKGIDLPISLSYRHHYCTPIIGNSNQEKEEKGFSHSFPSGL